MNRRLITLMFAGALIASAATVLASPAQPRDVEQAGEWSGRAGVGVKP